MNEHADWGSTRDALLRGITHALGNRMGALTGLTRILQYSDTGAEPLLETLAEELDRMQGVHALLMVLADEEVPIPTPLVLADLLGEVELLHRLRIDLREVAVQIEAEPAVLPLWAVRVPLTQALVLLVECAARQPGANAGAVVIRCCGDEEMVRVRTEPAATAAVATSLRALATAAGAEWDAHAAELRIPTLLAARRREG